MGKFIKDLLDGLPCMVMRFWQDFLDSLSSDGGHILMLVVLFAGLIYVDVRWKVQEAMNIALQVSGALLVILKEVGSNKTRRDRPTPTVETSTATVTETATNEKKEENK